jgi:hypothetical protein
MLLPKMNIGDRFGSWVVLSFAPKKRALCECQCLVKTQRTVLRRSLMAGISRSCGERGCGSLKPAQMKRTATNLVKYGTSTNLVSVAGGQRYAENVVNKYGVSNVMKLESIKQRVRDTTKERYGHEHALAVPEIRQRGIETKQKNMAADPNYVAKIVSKMEATNLANHGVRNSMHLPANVELVQKKLIDQKGGLHPFKTPKIMEKCVRMRKLRLTKIFVFDNVSLAEYCRKNDVCYISAQQTYKRYGRSVCERFLKHYNPRAITDIESLFLEEMRQWLPALEHFNKKIGDLPYRPDFRLEHKGKVIYVCVHGLFWHGEKKKAKDYHLKMRDAFHAAGLTLFQFYADEVFLKMPVVTSLILDCLGLTRKKISADSCGIEFLTTQQGVLFFQENHLMGPTTDVLYVGLFNKGLCEPCAVIGYRMRGETLEIARFATKTGLRVTDGFSTLLKAVSDRTEPSSIEALCDLRYSSGSSFEKLGFLPVSKTLGFEWTNSRVRFNRSHCAATEETKLYRIFDAGQVQFILTMNPLPNKAALK